MQNQAVIVSGRRTPIGSFLGSLASFTAPQLGAHAIRAAVEDSQVKANDIGQVIMGNVLPAGVGQAPARQAALGAELPEQVGALTINKVCGSGLMSVILAKTMVESGAYSTVVAGGMESMSNAPFLVKGMRGGLRLGHQSLLDSMVHDGLWDPYNDFHMGCAAELCAREQDVTRERQDQYAAESYKRALEAISQGKLSQEIIGIEVTDKKKQSRLVDQDEEPGRGDPSRFSALNPVFEKKGTVTAANASTLNDGAAALVVSSADEAQRLGLPVRARLGGWANAARKPEWFTMAPADAIRTLLDQQNLSAGDIDLFEINEAFSVVAVAVANALELDFCKVNVNGGAVALGHPIGASGARILITLLHAMEQRDAKRGIASICLGGGEALALLIER